MRRRFFVDEFKNGKARLEGDAAHHLGRVLRAEAGQRYELSDGHSVFLGQVENVGRDFVEFTVIEPVAIRESPLCVTLLLAVVKFDHFEWALEKATELGAGTIVPVAAERSEKPLLAAAQKRAERWQRILLESAQQARCLRIPALAPLARSADAFQRYRKGFRVLLSERSDARPLRAVLSAEGVPRTATIAAGSSDAESETSGGKFPDASSVAISLAIGPEGGWTDGEFSAAAAAGFVAASLGGNILRTETAVAAGLAAAHLFFDR